MSRRLLLAVLCGLLVSSPARAEETPLSEQVGDVGMRVFFGIPLTIVGGALMIPAGIATLITRPSEIDKTFDYLVMGPVRYTWVDPLGEHPDPDERPRLRSSTRHAREVPRPVPQGMPSGD